ncbi:MAG: two-component regulator propeller domain-containing protein [Bacteroidia bacterium]|nr:two-component regulator propeller domain-containing protein [Bacteroidia bacterium]
MVLLGVQRDVVAQERFVDKNTLSNLGMHQGLHGSFVDALCKDVHGFVWVATQGGGLARYDGYSFRTLDVQTSQIKSNFVKEVVPDLLGRVWVFTDMGVDVVDALSMQVVTSEFFGEEEREELSIPVLFAKLSSDGSTLWYASLDTLYAVRFVDSQDSEDMQEVLSIPMERNVTALGILDNKLCVALGAQMYQANIVGEDIKLDKITLPQEVVVDITSIYQDNNELWLGTVNGLFRLSKTSTKIYVSVFDNPTTLSQNMITSIVKTASGVMVISTLRGINVYNPNTDTFERVFSQPDEGDDERHFLSSDFINCMMVNGDEIWLGTEICGVDVISPIDLSVKNYTSKEHQGALPPYPVNVITEDNTGTLWVGVIEGGLNRKRLSSSKFETYTKSNHGLPHNAVSALAFDGSNHLWVGTWGGGVCELDINQVNAPVISYWGAGSYVGVLQYDPINDGVWVGTVTNIRFVKDGNTYAPFAGDATLESIDGTLGAMIDRDKKLWLGTSEGLIIADLTTLKEDKIEYQFIDHKLDDANSKLKPRVNYIMQATDGAIYIGTNGYGLTKVTDKGGEYQFKAYTTADGLCNNSVRGILEDKDGRLWLSTNFGLSVFDAKSESFVNYTKEQGLLSDSYYWNAAYKSSRDGSLYFGTPIGLTQIKQAKITRTEEKRVHAPIVTEVIVGGENLMAKESSWKNLSVHENSKSVEIFFSALQYVNTDAVRYQYKLEGFDDKWRMPQENNSALYTNLSPGDYVLRIRCTNGKSDWSTETRLEINVEPSFYKTWWFTIIVVLIVVFIIQLIYTIRTKALSAQKRMLNLMVEKRTSELANQNIILADQNNQIRQQNEQLQEMSNRIEKLSQDKLQFFTNISHELRTPITLIMGPIQKALKLSTNPQVIEQLNYCDRNSRYLLQLVNQLMDFRKVESGEVELNPKSTRIVPFMQDLVTPFTVYASDRGITLNSHIHTSHEVVKFDNDAMSKMLTNLLGNAVKYTHEGGVINFYLATIDKKLYISVEDNGDGIPEGEIEKVFDRFYQAENHKQYPIYGQSGTGIGLYVCKCLVDAQEGSIKAINNHRGGCTMRLVLPLEVALDVIDEEVDAIEQEEEEIQVVDTKKTILVVEDNKDMRKYIRSIVEEHYNVVEAGDGLDGLAQLTKASVDFIICDLMMPVMDGLEFINKVKHNFAYSHIPILVLTAQLSDEYRTKSYQIGVESYLQKPFDEEMLLARIKGILDSRRTDQDKFINTLDPNDLNIVQESDTDKFVRRALELIRNNYSEADYLIDNLARDLGCSKSMLNKKMQDVLGYTPGTILRTYRLNVAKKMLLACKDKKYLNVAQVAYEVGFNDPKYFTRCFTKFYGCTPTLFYEQGHEEAQQKERDTTDNLDEDIERLFNAVNNDNN